MNESMPSGAYTKDYAKLRTQQYKWRLDIPLAEAIRTLINQRSSLDFGAGIGHYCQALNCRGIDGTPGIEQLSDGRVIYGDLTDPNLVVPLHQVAISLEVAEHIPSEKQQVFLDHLTTHAELVILSWARPGQIGIGHINCRPFNEVVSFMQQRNFILNQKNTDSLRHMATISWLKENVAVYERKPQNGIANPHHFQTVQ